MLAATRPRPERLDIKQPGSELDLATLERDVSILRLLRDQIAAGKHPFLSVPAASQARLENDPEPSTSKKQYGGAAPSSAPASNSNAANPSAQLSTETSRRNGKQAAYSSNIDEERSSPKDDTRTNKSHDEQRSSSVGDNSLRARVSAPDVRKGNQASSRDYDAQDRPRRLPSPSRDGRRGVERRTLSPERRGAPSKPALSDRISKLADDRRMDDVSLPRKQREIADTYRPLRSRYDRRSPSPRDRLRDDSPPRYRETRESRRKPLDQRLDRRDKFAKQRRSPSLESAPSRAYNASRDQRISAPEQGHGGQRQGANSNDRQSQLITSTASQRAKPPEGRGPAPARSLPNVPLPTSIASGNTTQKQDYPNSKKKTDVGGPSGPQFAQRTGSTGPVPIGQEAEASRMAAIQSPIDGSRAREPERLIPSRSPEALTNETNPSFYPQYTNAVPKGHHPPSAIGHAGSPPYWSPYAAVMAQSNSQQEYNPSNPQYAGSIYQSQAISNMQDHRQDASHPTMTYPSQASPTPPPYSAYGSSSNFQQQSVPWPYLPPQSAPYFPVYQTWNTSDNNSQFYQSPY